MERPARSLAAVLLFALAGCSWRVAPEYSSVRYSLSGNATGLTITAVTDEWGSLRTFVGASLPWSLDYDNEALVPEPPVYLRFEASPAAAAIASGTAGAPVSGHLVDGGADFVAAGVGVGDVAVNTVTAAEARVEGVTATDLTLSDDIFPSAGQGYEVYRMVEVRATVTGDDEVLAQETYSGWGSSPTTATVIAENYTAP